MLNEINIGLKKIPFLSQEPDQIIFELAKHAKKAGFPKRTLIITEGDETDCLFIMLSGKVRVYSSDDEGREVTLFTQESGSYFGELALLSDEPRSASVVTLEKTTCGIISKTDFKIWLGKYPDVAFKLINDLSLKVVHVSGKIKQLALLNVYERTIKTLLDLATEKDGVSVIAERPTQQELANMVGASREMVNKIMKELTKGEYIAINEKSLTIEKKLPSSW
jgi:CRP/FNR family cyclic AMP-dependent transcriptional regulator